MNDVFNLWESSDSSSASSSRHLLPITNFLLDLGDAVLAPCLRHLPVDAIDAERSLDDKGVVLVAIRGKRADIPRLALSRISDLVLK